MYTGNLEMQSIHHFAGMVVPGIPCLILPLKPVGSQNLRIDIKVPGVSYQPRLIRLSLKPCLCAPLLNRQDEEIERGQRLFTILWQNNV